MHKGGANTTTYKFTKISPKRVEFKAGTSMFIFSGIFILMGIGAIIKFSMEPSGSLMFYGGIGLGILFIFSGISQMRGYSRPRMFDVDEGFFWREKKEPDETEENTDTQCRLNDIHAIQLIHERVLKSAGSAGSSDYMSFEINLVLNNADRINVVDHGSVSRIRKDADKLSEFLDKPVWNAITREF